MNLIALIVVAVLLLILVIMYFSYNNREVALRKEAEAQRASFATAQQRMLDIIRERETLLESMPSMWFIKNKEKIEYDVISSDVTESVISTRRENDIELFS